jgi:hypothetical protein
MDKPVTKVTIGDSLVKDIETKQISNSYKWADENAFVHADVVGVAMSLTAAQIAKMEYFEVSITLLTDEGKNVICKGSTEVILWNALPANGQKNKTDLVAIFGDKKFLSIAINQAMEKKWVEVKKSGDEQFISRKEKDITDVTAEQLKLIQQGNPEKLSKNNIENLKRRKLVHIKYET